MTDKEIIIDGVNVAGCRLYEHNPEYRMYNNCDCKRIMVPQSSFDELSGAECKGYDCYYKQLQHKSQECEELKKRLKAEIHLGNNYKKDFAEQVTEAQHYKQALEKIEEIFKNDVDGDYDFIKFKIFNIINEVKDAY